MQELAQLLTNGLVVASILAVGAIGITLVFGILDIGNFAHGDYLTFGMYVAFGVNVAAGLPFFAALIVAAAATAVLGIVVDAIVLRWFRDKGADAMLIVTLGVALILRNILYLIFGSQPRTYDVDVVSVYEVAGIRISGPQLMAIVVAVLVIVAIAWVLARTSVGRSMRAIADNRDLAAVAGVDIDRTRRATWLISSGLAGLAGCLQALVQSSFNPESGWSILLLLFTAAILGGLRSAYGTLLGALILGLTMEVSTWSGFFGGLDGVYKPVIAFVVLLGLLLIRPQGLIGKGRPA